MKLYIHQHKATILAGILFFSLACLIAIADRAPLHTERAAPGTGIRDGFQRYYEGMINQTLRGPYVYRIMIPYLLKFIKELVPPLDLMLIDAILKVFFLMVCQVSFFLYLGMFFSPRDALYGVLWLDVLLAFSLSTDYGPTMGETADLCNAAIYSLALLALYRNSFFVFCLLIFVGIINRETPLLLCLLPAVVGKFSKQAIGRTAAALLMGLVPYLLIRQVISVESPAWFSTEAIIRNIPFLSEECTVSALLANLHMVLLLGPLAFLSAYKLNEQPVFFRQMLTIVPLFIIIHYIVGSIIEARLWMPVFILLIPPAMNTLRLIFSNDVVKRFT